MPERVKSLRFDFCYAVMQENNTKMGERAIFGSLQAHPVCIAFGVV